MKKLDWKRIGWTVVYTPLLLIEIAANVFILSFIPTVCGYNFSSIILSLFLMFPISAAICWTLGRIYFYYHNGEEEK